MNKTPAIIAICTTYIATRHRAQWCIEMVVGYCRMVAMALLCKKVRFYVQIKLGIAIKGKISRIVFQTGS